MIDQIDFFILYLKSQIPNGGSSKWKAMGVYSEDWKKDIAVGKTFNIKSRSFIKCLTLDGVEDRKKRKTLFF